MMISSGAQAPFPFDSEFRSFFFLLRAGRVPDAYKTIQKIETAAFWCGFDCEGSGCAPDAVLNLKIAAVKKILNYVSDVIMHERRNPTNFVDDQMRAKLRKALDCFDRIGATNQVAPADVDCRKKGKCTPQEKGEVADAPERDIAKEIQDLDAHLLNTPLLSDISHSTPSFNPSISTPDNQLSTDTNHNVISFPLRASKKSSHRVLTSNSGSTEFTQTRAKRANRDHLFDRSLEAITHERKPESQKRIQALPNPFSRDWKNINHEIHLLTAFLYANKARDNGATVGSFRLSFSPARIRMLLKDPKPASRVARWLRKVFADDVDYAFKFEVSKKGVLHLHGFYVLPEHDSRKSPYKAMQRGLLKASGDATVSASSHSAAFYDGLGYYSYLMKAERKTLRLLEGKKITYMSDGMKKQTIEFHKQMRGHGSQQSIALITMLDFTPIFRLAA